MKVFAIVRNILSNIEMIIEHENINIIYCDLDEIQQIEQIIPDKNIDVFFHLAWAGASGPDRANHEIQMKNISNSLECAKQSKILGCSKFIAIGTIGEFMAELALKNSIVSENFTYALSKNFYHSLLDIYCYKNDINYTWCTLSGVFGKGDKTSNIINYTIQKLLLNETPEFTKAEQFFDFIYIEDCVDCLIQIGFDNGTDKYFFIGGPRPLPLKEFLKKTRNVVSPESKLGFGIRKDDGTVYLKEWFTMGKTIQQLGFSHKYTFEDGIKLTLEWIKTMNK